MDPMLIKNMIPLALFAGIAFVWWTALEAIVRYRILREGTSESLLAAMIAGDARRRRRNALRWGLVLAAVGVGLVALQVFAVRIDTPIAAGVLLLAAGAAQLVFHRLTRADG